MRSCLSMKSLNFRFTSANSGQHIHSSQHPPFNTLCTYHTTRNTQTTTRQSSRPNTPTRCRTTNTCKLSLPNHPHIPAITHNLHPNSQADEDDLDDLSFGGPASASAPLKPQSSSSSKPQNQNPLSGRIGSGSGSGSGSGGGRGGGTRENWGGVRMETRYTGESTLDEPVSTTIVRPWALAGVESPYAS